MGKLEGMLAGGVLEGGGSPRIGRPIAASWRRIWWVRPVEVCDTVHDQEGM